MNTLVHNTIDKSYKLVGFIPKIICTNQIATSIETSTRNRLRTWLDDAFSESYRRNI